MTQSARGHGLASAWSIPGYDYLLGGKDNYATDREAALALTTAIPGAAQAARDNRAFLARAVRCLAGQAGITQFLDIGTGLPTRGHVHEIAQAANPGARVAYVDNDRCNSGCVHARRDIASRAERAPRPFVTSPILGPEAPPETACP